MKTAHFWWLLPLGGALTALCLIFPVIGALEWLTLAPALLFLFAMSEGRPLPFARDREEGIDPPRIRRFYLFGLLCFYPFYLTIYHWFFALYPMEFSGVDKATAAGLVVLCWLGLSTLQAVFSAAMFPLYAALSRGRALSRLPFLKPFLFAGIFTVFEWHMTLTFAGVPWARLALGQIELGFMTGGAALFGSYFITFALVAFNALIAYGVLHLDRARAVSVAAAAVLLLNMAAGAVGFLTADVAVGEGYLVAAVQGNVGSAEKWSVDSAVRTREIYEKYTARAAEAGAVLVVFPETFLPYCMDEGTATREYLVQLATTYGVTIQCGGFTFDEDFNEYNGVFTVYPSGVVSDTVYKKRHLVPFGEYVPMRALAEAVVPALADIGMLSDDLSPGTGSELVMTPVGMTGSLICFDSIYETLTLDSVRDGAVLLTLPTNDSWFTDSAAADMHNAQARLRAIEVDRYIIRSADTGISSIITPRGVLLDKEPPMVEGMAMATVYPNTVRTLYSYIGNLPVYLLLGALYALGIFEIVCLCRKGKQKVALAELE